MKVDFFLACPSEIDDYLPIYHLLLQKGVDAQFVLLKPHKKQPPHTKENFNDLLAVLCRRNLNFIHRILPSVDIVITTGTSTPLQKYKKMRIKMRYGVGLNKDNPHYEEYANVGFDGILVHGEFERERFASLHAPERIKAMGMPKYDTFFHSPSLTGDELKKKLPLDSSKKTLVYLPTWGEHSSIELLFSSLKKLSEEFEIVVKPHSHTEVFSSEKTRFQKLKQLTRFVLPSSTPIHEPLALADLVIADAKSGAAPEAALLFPKVPLVTITPFQSSLFFEEINLLGPVLNQPHDLKTCVRSMMSNDSYEVKRRQFRDYAFACDSISGAEKAVKGMLELSEMQPISQQYTKKLRKEKNILSRLKRSIQKRFKKC